MRLGVAKTIADEILKVKDGMVALALLERAQAIFTSDTEREIFKPTALEAYILGNRPDDAFALAAELLAKNPDDIFVLIRMTQTGTEEVRKKNRKYADVSLEYGLKAIARLEASNKIVNGDLEVTLEGYLDQLYQQTAILYLAAGNTQEAKTRLTKASTLSPQDPTWTKIGISVAHAKSKSSSMFPVAEPSDLKSKSSWSRRCDGTVLPSALSIEARMCGISFSSSEINS
jgi:tetratricopeptide (TPR) repeat protein